MAEFAANANLSASIKLPPFQAMWGYVSRINFNSVDLLEKLTLEQFVNSKARSIAANMKKILRFVRKKMAQSQEIQAEAAN